MKVLSDYTIRCTPEQVCKAINLGAILDICDWRYVDTPLCMTMTNNGELIGHFMLPTAEQMIGFLRSKGVKFYLGDNEDCWSIGIEKTILCYGRSENKELAAIDAALEYLNNQNK